VSDSARRAHTPNQVALLRALSSDGACVVGNGRGMPTHVRQPGVPAPTLYANATTVRACLRRGWLTGDRERGYAINGLGVLALGAAE
jgi:hypothetical protein